MKISIESSFILEEYGAENFAKMIKEAGFAAIDWNIEREWPNPDIWQGKTDNHSIFDEPLEKMIEFYTPEAEVFKKYGLTFAQAHAPFPVIISDRPYMQEYTIPVLERTIKLCSHFNVPYLVVHGTCLYGFEKKLDHDGIERLNIDYFKRLIPTLKGSGVTLCLENLFCGYNGKRLAGFMADPYQAVRVIDELNDLAGEELFGTCLDTGHLHVASYPFRKYMSIVGNRIKCLHIQDNDGANDQHIMPYTCNLDWEGFIAGCIESGYNGDINFETGNQYKKSYLPEELISSFLKVTADVGYYFKKRIEEKKKFRD